MSEREREREREQESEREREREREGCSVFSLYSWSADGLSFSLSPLATAFRAAIDRCPTKSRRRRLSTLNLVSKQKHTKDVKNQLYSSFGSKWFVAETPFGTPWTLLAVTKEGF